MCGIFGYIGKKDNAAEVVLEGLRLLEYRGYDSWGVAVRDNKKLAIEKHAGKIGKAKTSLPKSTMGIGHARWATHGGITDKNAHPHFDCTKEIAVLHNGIIENFAEIKDDLQKKGHTFISETDTEVFSHLVEENLKKVALPAGRQGFASSVRDAFNTIRGLNAVVVAYAPAKEIIAAKTGSPLVLGKDKDAIYIASDAAGIIRHTKNILFLKDNEMVIIGDGSIQLVSLPVGEKLMPQFEKVDWKVEDVSLGKYPHFMLKEIYEQPKVIRSIVENHAEQIADLADLVHDAKGTFLIGAGTAGYACLAGTYLFSKISKHHVNTAAASEFNYLEDFLTKDSLIIVLSQSGETIDVIEPLNRAKKKKSTVVAIVNVLGSTIYRMADYKLLLNAGPEKAVASTKAYIAKLVTLLMLSYAMNGSLSKAKSILLKTADEVEKIFEKENIDKLQSLAEFLVKKEHIYAIGRGTSYATALEASLKIKEVSCIHTEGLAGGELKHGTIALIEKGTPVLVFAPKDETYAAILSNAMEIKARGGYIIGISPENSDVFETWIESADMGDASIISQIIPIQLLAYYLAVRRGFDPDKPRNLAKSVTVK